MKFGVSYNPGFLGTDPGQLVAVARHAEDCGFESFYLPEHIVLYPGAMLGPAQIPPALPFADPLECLSFVAAATSR
ncbi:MAG TPA: LLM class F420-dependent oxidoreductase, partial [Streptosporangiaceae bacterium]